MSRGDVWGLAMRHAVIPPQRAASTSFSLYRSVPLIRRVPRFFILRSLHLRREPRLCLVYVCLCIYCVARSVNQLYHARKLCKHLYVR